MSNDILRDLRGFGTVEKWVLTDPEISTSAKALYALICAYAGNKGQSFPSTSLLSHQLSVSRPTLQKSINQLKGKLVISVEQKRSGGRFSHNVYSLLNQPNSTVAKNTDDGKADNSNSDDSNTGDNEVYTKINSVKNNSSKSNSNNTNAHSSKYSEEFERWWSIYPRKQGKGKAYSNWKREKLDLRVDELIEKLQQQVAMEYAFTDIGYIPHGSTYLNESRYDDDVIPKGVTNEGNFSNNHKSGSFKEFATELSRSVDENRHILDELPDDYRF